MHTKVALITGASAGIGAALSRVYAREGYDLVIVARRKEQLEALAQEIIDQYQRKVTIIVQDLSQLDAVEEICQILKKESITVDTLINNAGVSVYGNFWETEEKDEFDVLKINVEVPMLLTKRLLPDMVEKKSGHLVAIASVAAFLPAAKTPLYYATKAFLLSFYEGLSEALRGTGVKVTIICPGPTKTDFREKGFEGERNPAAALVKLSAEEVAEYTYDAMKSGKVVAIPGVGNKFLVGLIRIFPRRIARYIIGRNQ